MKPDSLYDSDQLRKLPIFIKPKLSSKSLSKLAKMVEKANWEFKKKKGLKNNVR